MNNKELTFYDLNTTIVFGYNRIEDKFVYINDCANGLRCGLVCRFCGKPLNAKNKCNFKHDHFAHKANSGCKQGHEATIPLLLKRVLDETKAIKLPTCYHPRDFSIYHSYESLQIKSVELERYDKDHSFNVVVESVDGERIAIIPYIKSENILIRKKEASEKYKYVLCINFNYFKNSNYVVIDTMREMVTSEKYNKLFEWVKNKELNILEERYNSKIKEKNETIKKAIIETEKKKNVEIIKPEVVDGIKYYRLRDIERMNINQKSITIKNRYYPEVEYIIDLEKPFVSDRGNLIGRRKMNGAISEPVEITFLKSSFWQIL